MFKTLSATVLSLMVVLLLAGCGGGESTEKADDATKAGAAEQTQSEHPKAEHPHGGEADSDSTKSEHPKSEHPKSDHPN